MKQPFNGPVVLDADALSRLVKKDQYLSGVITAALASKVPVVVSAATIVEVSNKKTNLAALRWAISRVSVEPVTKEIAMSAAGLIIEAGFSGHSHTIDSIVCATALALPGKANVFTSDPTDIELLTNGLVNVIPLR